MEKFQQNHPMCAYEPKFKIVKASVFEIIIQLTRLKEIIGFHIFSNCIFPKCICFKLYFSKVYSFFKLYIFLERVFFVRGDSDSYVMGEMIGFHQRK